MAAGGGPIHASRKPESLLEFSERTVRKRFPTPLFPPPTGKRIIGIIEGDSVPDLFIPSLVELYTQGRFPFDKLVKFYNLDQINQAAEDSEKGITIKPIIRLPS